MTPLNLQIFIDGSKRILVVDNCVGDTLELFNAMVRTLFSLPDTTAKEIPCLVPSEEADIRPPETEKLQAVPLPVPCAASEKADIPIEKGGDTFPDIALMTGNYAGMTPKEAVETDGLKAVVDICSNIKEIEQEEVREQLLLVCKRLLSEDLERRTPETSETAEVAEFLQTYRPLLSMKFCRFVLENSGYSDMDQMLADNDPANRRTVYKACIDNLQKRIS